MSDETPVVEDTKVPEVLLYVQTNNLTDPAPYEMLKMFYKGAYDNTIGLMEALNEETGGLEYLIVGLVPDEVTGQVKAIPIAKVFEGPEESYKYAGPDGKGGYSRDDDNSDLEVLGDYDAAAVQ